MATHTDIQLLWVRYCPQTMLAQTTALSTFAELAHRRLADYAWSANPWLVPSSDAFLAVTRIPSGSLEAVLDQLKSVGWRIRNNRLFNSEMNAILISSRTLRDAGRVRAKARANTRWHRKPGTIGQNPAPQNMLQQCYSNATAMLQHPTNHATASFVTCTDRPTDRQTDRPTLVAVNGEQLTVNQAVAAASPLSGSPPLQGGDSKTTKGLEEGTFLAELFAALKSYNPAQAKAEMTNWGGWWRIAYRTNPDKSRRVLADLSNMISEGRITSNPGAAAADLWKRLPD